MQQTSTRVISPGNLPFYLNFPCILSGMRCRRAVVGFRKGDLNICWPDGNKMLLWKRSSQYHVYTKDQFAPMCHDACEKTKWYSLGSTDKLLLAYSNAIILIKDGGPCFHLALVPVNTETAKKRPGLSHSRAKLYLFAADALAFLTSYWMKINKYAVDSLGLTKFGKCSFNLWEINKLREINKGAPWRRFVQNLLWFCLHKIPGNRELEYVSPLDFFFFFHHWAHLFTLLGEGCSGLLGCCFDLF